MQSPVKQKCLRICVCMYIVICNVLFFLGNMKLLQCISVWIGWSECLLRACKWTQTSLSNIIRHIYSRVQCKSKQGSHRWSCCIRILSFMHVNKLAVTSPGCVYCSCIPFAFPLYFLSQTYFFQWTRRGDALHNNGSCFLQQCENDASLISPI